MRLLYFSMNRVNKVIVFVDSKKTRNRIILTEKKNEKEDNWISG